VDDRQLLAPSRGLLERDLGDAFRSALGDDRVGDGDVSMSTPAKQPGMGRVLAGRKLANRSSLRRM
jgi:hypothetical protein